MKDIVERLRKWTIMPAASPASDLMDEAADEIERLRGDWPEQLQAHSVLIAEQELEIQRLRLTAEEREAVAYYLGTGGPYNVDRTLVALLSRTGTDGKKTGDDSSECHSQSVKCPERDHLTGAEREAVRFCTTAALPETQKLGGVAGELCRLHAATLRALLERL